MTTQFNDTLADLGGVCLFDPLSKTFAKNYSFLRERTPADWDTIGQIYHGFHPTTKAIYVRFVNPNNKRFGSIARLYKNNSGYTPYYSNYIPPQSTVMHSWNNSKSISNRIEWDGRTNHPYLYTWEDDVEWLPNYSGPTVWAYDKERSKRVDQKIAYDRLGREIEVGQFCCYILYKFDGPGAANIYFGTVTEIEPNGDVHCTNVTLSSKEKSDKRKVKDSKLITILTDDLMRQLMMAKLSNG